MPVEAMVVAENPVFPSKFVKRAYSFSRGVWGNLEAKENEKKKKESLLSLNPREEGKKIFFK